MLPNVQRTDAADHVPVLAEEVRELLAVQPGETIVDATFGAGGHSRLLAADLQGSGKLVAIDRDPSVRAYFDRVKASTRGVQTRFLRGDYAVVLSQLAGNGVRADAVLLDLGLSSMQVDRPERGFSYATDAPLDMRMDPSEEISAADVIATWDERELETIFRKYGEERYARQIARAIVRRRAESPIERTGQLVDVVRASIPAPARFGEGHPAKRVFQALRIEVNHELESLEVGLPAAFEMLRPGGRLAVISFHSLEDRIVKHVFRALAAGEAALRVLTRKPVTPGDAEVARNPRARSAKLRAIERLA
jgi:16S rRNA (cytosine1402-N4)-methyltransferase